MRPYRSRCRRVTVVTQSGARVERILPSDMAEIVNLRTERKRVAKRAEERRADINRLAHGRTKADRERNNAQTVKREHDLDQHLIKSGDSE